MKQLFRTLFGARGAAPPAPRRRSVRLGLESLDERIVPATVQRLGDLTGSALGNQDMASSDRTVARSTGAGNYAVVWRAEGSGGDGLFVRLFRADNTPLTGPVHIASTTSAEDFGPSIAMNAGGEFAVAWTHAYFHNYAISDEDIRVQRFTADGAPHGYYVAAWSPQLEKEPSVALDAYGNLMVAYTYWYDDSDQDIYVWTQRASGATSTFKLATSGVNEHAPSLAVNAHGDGVVAYEYDYSEPSSWGPLFGVLDHDIHARRVTTGSYSGAPGAVGGDIRVVTDGKHQFDPSASINSYNEFVVSYTEDAENGGGYPTQVYARRFDAANNYRGQVSVGDSWDGRSEYDSSVAMDDNGRFIVAFTHEYSATDRDVRAQVFNYDNSARGSWFWVSGSGSYSEYVPTVALGVTDLTSNYSGGAGYYYFGGYHYYNSGSYYGQAVFSFQTFGLKQDASGNSGYGVSVAQAWSL